MNSYQNFDPFLKNLTTRPGVYTFLGEEGTPLYVGKAKNLKKRITSYFKRQLDAKTIQLVSQIQNIDVTVTRNEREALLLENQLIQSQKPRYNVIFRDDKSYPFLWLTLNETYPRLSFYRGSRKEAGQFYGPYPSAGDARLALSLLQSIFKIRQCDNYFFKNRTRPCLQYQIKRCTAPCVNYISPQEYQSHATSCQLFLEGKSDEVLKALIQKMEEASHQLRFEEAGRLRDQIALLRKIQDHRLNAKALHEADVIGISKKDEACLIHILSVREGRVLGSRHYFSDKSTFMEDDENEISSILESFILQHYREELGTASFPDVILLPTTLESEKDINDILNDRAHKKIELVKPERGDRLKWIEMANISAHKALLARKPDPKDLTPRFEAFKEDLKLESIPESIECFDISHTLGEATVASRVVFDIHGPRKTDYRRFNIRAETKGDDYAALNEGLTRHFTKLKSEGMELPDVLMIDGGKGQLNVAKAVLTELQVEGVVLISVAKGPQRKSGLETIYILQNGDIDILTPSPKAFQLICEIRDEAHRFAITAHRKQRRKRRLHSTLEDIPGVGKKRRSEILKHFGGLQAVQQASIDALAQVPGVHRALAERIYQALHGE